ncbi:diacylglycerol kinase [Rhodovibrio sodomensis]|uniref:Dihydrofolate reductase n=1 Tax=Rhodovibrio sodomensis TaxID=1088 RepID=A0ABS1DKY0_9PROT|nr:dihydrofolate reductase [Rhodovibrio sodomensis]MBK1670772.1 diacylglycerol kinase [Rhodovibrio sodomensis]
MTLVVAADRAGGIGQDGGLPWRLPDDLKWFKRVTIGYPLVMGRKTHESIGRSLPGRLNLVITRQDGYRPFDGAEVVGSLQAALDRAAREDAGEVMVIGGAEIFRATLPHADRVLLTRVHDSFAADTFLDELDPAQWRETWREGHPADARNPHAYSFIEVVRR